MQGAPRISRTTPSGISSDIEATIPIELSRYMTPLAKSYELVVMEIRPLATVPSPSR